MRINNRILLFFLLPALAPLLYPPDTLLAGLQVILFALGLFAFLGVLLLRGSSHALTLSIFIQGFNVIIRLMMFFPNAKPAAGPLDVSYVIFSLLSIGLSAYLMFRLDEVDIRARMVT